MVITRKSGNADGAGTRVKRRDLIKGYLREKGDSDGETKEKSLQSDGGGATSPFLRRKISQARNRMKEGSLALRPKSRLQKGVKKVERS